MECSKLCFDANTGTLVLHPLIDGEKSTFHMFPCLTNIIKNQFSTQGKNFNTRVKALLQTTQNIALIIHFHKPN